MREGREKTIPGQERPTDRETPTSKRALRDEKAPSGTYEIKLPRTDAPDLEDLDPELARQNRAESLVIEPESEELREAARLAAMQIAEAAGDSETFADEPVTIVEPAASKSQNAVNANNPAESSISQRQAGLQTRLLEFMASKGLVSVPPDKISNDDGEQ
jgi:hypothetical protein